MPNFVDMVIDISKEYESPTSFWRWSAYAIIAATLRDNVYLEHSLGRIYPNMFILLTADSAESRKNAPFQIVDELLTAVKTTKIVKGRNSIQYVQERLSMDGLDRAANGVSIKGGSGIMLAKELAAFFVNDPSLSSILADMYDFDAEYAIGLKSNGGGQKIKNLCLSMFAASNDTFLKDVFTLKAIYGGLLRRTFMIAADETREGKSLFALADLPKADKKPLIESLQKIQLLKGPITFTKEARVFYDAWYDVLYKSYKKKPDRTGFTQGVHTLVMKLAIAIAASNHTLELTEAHMEEAINETIKLKPAYDKYAMSTGKSNLAEIGAVILADLWAAPNHELTIKTLLMRHWSDLPRLQEDLENLANTLVSAGMLVTTFTNNQVGYKLTPASEEIYATQLTKKKGE